MITPKHVEEIEKAHRDEIGGAHGKFLATLERRRRTVEFFAVNQIAGMERQPEDLGSLRLAFGFVCAYEMYQLRTLGDSQFPGVTLDRAWNHWINGRIEWTGYTWKEGE